MKIDGEPEKGLPGDSRTVDIFSPQSPQKVTSTVTPVVIRKDHWCVMYKICVPLSSGSSLMAFYNIVRVSNVNVLLTELCT